MKFNRREVLQLSAALPFLGQARAEQIPVLDIVSRMLVLKARRRKYLASSAQAASPA